MPTVQKTNAVIKEHLAVIAKSYKELTVILKRAEVLKNAVALNIEKLERSVREVHESDRQKKIEAVRKKAV